MNHRDSLGQRLSKIGPFTASSEWLWALLLACLVAGLVSNLFYYWFAVADRYFIFLYNHHQATPFDERTGSRYWMAGLVASGVVAGVYILANWYLGRLAGLICRRYAAPAWWQVWLLAAGPVALSILLITMTLNQPTLPWLYALPCVVAALAGLALALLPGRLAAQQPLKLFWLGVIGAGLTPVFLLLRVIELPAQGLISSTTAYTVAIGSNLAGVAWLFGGVWLQRRLHNFSVEPGEILAAGLCWSYLVLPLAHYLLFTPPQYRYISVAANFFAANPGIQLLSFGVALATVQLLKFDFIASHLKKEQNSHELDRTTQLNHRHRPDHTSFCGPEHPDGRLSGRGYH